MALRGTMALLGLAALVSGCIEWRETNPVSTTTLTSYREPASAAREVREGRYAEALATADAAVKLAPDDAWAQYDRAVALHHLGRVKESVAVYQTAERVFQERFGKSIAIYGRARALSELGRCDEATKAYTGLMRPVDPAAANTALAYSNDCQAPPASVENSGWTDYNRALALAAKARTDDAVMAYLTAEAHFGDDSRGHALAVYGRARALDNAGRCEEAKAAYRDYATFVRATSPEDAAMATSNARACGAH